MGSLSRVKMSTLIQIAGGTFVVGSTCVYLARKFVQWKVRALPHYREAFQIISHHDKALKALGPPIKVGDVDLTDRQRNYIDEFTSELRIPISGQVDGGFLDVFAVRNSRDAEFEMCRIDLELEVAETRVVIYDDQRWNSEPAANS
ncbi:hypothetical protein AB6A40_005588 [Gnathostoma spinigerum]|uniref:Uncharacterized protein n=1 Tax=Gnathostoma spinigerum TaxID=75299 RepID=A0ABD6EL47_9BILA